MSNVAMVKAQDMYNNNYFDHNSPTHGSPCDMLKEFGITYNSAGENIAKGQNTHSQVMKDWMNSPGQRPVVLHPRNPILWQISPSFYSKYFLIKFGRNGRFCIS